MVRKMIMDHVRELKAKAPKKPTPKNSAEKKIVTVKTTISTAQNIANNPKISNKDKI